MALMIISTSSHRGCRVGEAQQRSLIAPARCDMKCIEVHQLWVQFYAFHLFLQFFGFVRGLRRDK